MSDELRLKKTAVGAFRRRWRKIVKDITEGRRNYVDERYPCFEADTPSRQRKLAERFYGIEHAKKMAALSNEQIEENLSCYMPKAIEYALKENDDEPKEQEAFMKRLVSSEYVIFDSHSDGWFDEYDDDAAVSEYPSTVAYDDWYERSVGTSLYSFSTSILMKSTGEPFTRQEIAWLKRSIQNNIDKNDISALWWFALKPMDKNRIWIRIHEYADRKQYVEEFLGETAGMTESQLRELIRRMLEYLNEHKKLRRRLGAFKNCDTMNRHDLLCLVGSFIISGIEKDFLYDWDIRAIEGMMLDITGRYDKDYHYG